MHLHLVLPLSLLAMFLGILNGGVFAIAPQDLAGPLPDPSQHPWDKHPDLHQRLKKIFEQVDETPNARIESECILMKVL